MALNSDKSDYVCIDDAKKKTKYLCIDCESELITKQGKKIQWHYAHKTNTSCNGESWKHIYSKYLIDKYLTDMEFAVKCYDCDIIHHKTNFANCTSVIEYSYDKYWIDVGILENNKLKYAFEVVNTCPVTLEKKNFLKNNGIELFEIECDRIIKNLHNRNSQYKYRFRIKSKCCEICEIIRIEKKKKERAERLEKEKEREQERIDAVKRQEQKMIELEKKLELKRIEAEERLERIEWNNHYVDPLDWGV